ncbi:hypothetical protein ACIA5G_13430 [Amycolatopsis sp. NPDC051758]|uniref:hypothetical protein n=1 Tax=Amycolatopsis sp. NPDC051758 TaxID=3363935 RepID=UPI0037B3F376
MLTLLVYLSPMLLLMVVFGVVAVVALCQARPEDVPQVFTEATNVFRKLSGRARKALSSRDTEGGEEEVRP